MVTLIQSFGLTKWFGIKLPVMMGVTFRRSRPHGGHGQCHAWARWRARDLWCDVIGAGIVSMLLAPVMGKLLRFFPPVVTGSIIAVIGISLMRVGVSWATGAPAQFAQNVDVPKPVAMVDGAKASVASAAEAAAATGAAAHPP